MSKISFAPKIDQDATTAKVDQPADASNAGDNLEKVKKGKSAEDKLPKVKPTDAE